MTVMATSPDETLSWRDRAVARSLEQARRRAEGQSARFVKAALDVVEETGAEDFTIQAVVERSRASTRTFYQHFAGKDDLLVAMFEEAERLSVVRLRPIVDAASDPVARLRAFIVGRQLVSRPTPLALLLVNHHLRLQQSRPEELRLAFEPVVGYLRDLVRDAQDAGAIPPGDPTVVAGVVLQTVVTFIHAQLLGSALTDWEASPEEVADFVLLGIGAAPARSGPLLPGRREELERDVVRVAERQA